MTVTSRSFWWSLVVLVVWANPSAGQETLRQELIERAGRLIYPDTCRECHRSSFDVWEATPHAQGYDTLHRRDSAKAIYRRMDLRTIKRGSEEVTPACLQCHYTPEVRRGTQLRAGAGVSCESCHGPARDWINTHNAYGVDEPDFQKASLLETPEHKAQRIEQSEAQGMLRPSQLYGVVANCYQCHTVPHEDLVNRGLHSTGSDFELVEWSQGIIRHNFLESFLTADGTENAERPPEWKRRVYVVGRALAMEYNLRGVAVATDGDGLYLASMIDRSGDAVDELLDITDRESIPEIQEILDIFDGVELKANDATVLLAAADAVGEATRRFIVNHDGTRLASLDPLYNPDAPDTFVSLNPPPLPPPVTTSDPPPPVTTSDPPPPVTTSDPPPPVTTSDPPPPVTTSDPPPPVTTSDLPPTAPTDPRGPTPPDPDVAPPPPPPPPAERPARAGVVRTRPAWRPEPAHDTIKVPCGRCHGEQEAQWRKDPHSKTSKPLRAGKAPYQDIARAYGITVDDMDRGNQICMSCHGTVVTGKERRSVRAGVGCQRCHGPGKDYLEPHEESYSQSLTLGMNDLKDATVRATVCAGCHYITDQGLIDAGHATGAEFDLVMRNGDIRHWGDEFGGTAVEIAAPALQSAHASVIAERGPAPGATVAPPRVTSAGPAPAVTPTDPPPAVTPTDPPPAVTPTDPPPAVTPTDPPPPPPPPRPRSTPRPRTAEVVAGDDLPPLDVGSDASVEEVILLLKERLELIYERAREGRPR